MVPRRSRGVRNGNRSLLVSTGISRAANKLIERPIGSVFFLVCLVFLLSSIPYTLQDLRPLLSTGWISDWLSWPKPIHVMLSVTVAASYAIFDEFYQGFIPERTSNWNDVWLDLSGILLGILLFSIGRRNRK